MTQLDSIPQQIIDFYQNNSEETYFRGIGDIEGVQSTIILALTDFAIGSEGHVVFNGEIRNPVELQGFNGRITRSDSGFVRLEDGQPGTLVQLNFTDNEIALTINPYRGQPPTYTFEYEPTTSEYVSGYFSLPFGFNPAQYGASNPELSGRTDLDLNDYIEHYLFGKISDDNPVVTPPPDNEPDNNTTQLIGPFVTQATAQQRRQEYQSEGYEVSGVFRCSTLGEPEYCFNIFPVPEPPIIDISLFISDTSSGEGNGGNTNFTFTVSLNQASDQTVTVDYSTENDSAIANEDYIATNGILEFAPGETEKTITIEVIGDREIESDESFFLNLSNLSEGSISDNQGIATITNDDNNDSNPIITSLDNNINRFQNRNIPGTYLFTGEQESQNIRDNFPNFEEEGLAFKVADEPGDNLIPLYRFQSLITPGTYLFVGEQEREDIKENFSESFTEEGLAFYVYGVGSGLGIEFTRFQNNDKPGTYLFAGIEEAENIRNNFPNFLEEGIAFEVGI